MPEPRLTILTAPKKFVDPHISIIQRNALRSWQALGASVEIIVLGKDEGIAENSRNLGIRHISDVQCNSLGTPLVSSMLELGQNASSSPFIGIVNTDIILFPDLLDAVELVSNKFNNFLLVGQRLDLEVTDEIKSGLKSFIALKDSIKSKAILHLPMGSDYFIFPRSCYSSIPDFAIGRAGWDNWFIYKSRREGWKVVDGTHDVMIVHQNHDYHHLPNGKPHYRLPETKENVEQGGGDHTIFSLFDAQYNLVNGKIVGRKLSLKKILREIEVFPLIRLKSHALGRLFFLLARPKRAYSEIRRIWKG